MPGWGLTRGNRILQVAAWPFTAVAMQGVLGKHPGGRVSVLWPPEEAERPGHQYPGTGSGGFLQSPQPRLGTERVGEIS